MTKMNERDVLTNRRSLLAITGLFAFLSAGCSTQAMPIPLSNITGDTGGQGICVLDGDPFDCTITDVTDGSGYSRIWEISGALNDEPVDALLFANRDGQSWQMEMTQGETNLISGVDVQAFRTGGMGCLKPNEGEPLFCLDRQSPPFADISCGDDGSALPKSGLCRDSATKWLDFPDGQVGAVMAPYPGCEWRVQETMFGEYAMMLYLASHCDGKTVRLGLNGGAKTGTLTEIPDVTDLDNPLPDLITLISADPIQQWDNLESISQPTENVDYRCEAQSASLEGWPSDAVIVDRVGAVDSGPDRAECGHYGYSADSMSFWRIVGPFAAHFNLGQDAYQPVSPSSLTYMEKDQSGNWTRWAPEDIAPVQSGIYPLASEDERPRTQDGCDRLGGNWQQAGLLGSFRCTFKYPDAGAACSDSTDCLGSCYAPAGQSEPDTKQPGLCQATDSPFGCNAPVVNGTVMAPICVD